MTPDERALMLWCLRDVQARVVNEATWASAGLQPGLADFLLRYASRIADVCERLEQAQ
jgi:hypothetical protein